MSLLVTGLTYMTFLTCLTYSLFSQHERIDT